MNPDEFFLYDRLIELLGPNLPFDDLQVDLLWTLPKSGYVGLHNGQLVYSAQLGSRAHYGEWHPYDLDSLIALVAKHQ